MQHVHVAARRSCRASLGCASICDVRVARVHATCSSGCLRVNLLRPHRRQSMHVLRDGHTALRVLCIRDTCRRGTCVLATDRARCVLRIRNSCFACTCVLRDGHGTVCASHPEHVRSGRWGVSASDSVSALYVPSQRIPPSLLALSSFFELRDLTLLSLSPKELRTRVTLMCHCVMCPALPTN